MSILAAIVLDTITEADTLAFVEYLDAPRVRVRPVSYTHLRAHET